MRRATTLLVVLLAAPAWPQANTVTVSGDGSATVVSVGTQGPAGSTLPATSLAVGRVIYADSASSLAGSSLFTFSPATKLFTLPGLSAAGADTYTGVGTATEGAPRWFLGTNTTTNDDSAILIGRKLVGENLFSHAIRDESTFTSSTTGAYASFDANPRILGSLNPYNHVYAFQARLDYAGSGVLTAAQGFYGQMYISGPGTVGAFYGFRILNANISGGGSLTSQYGIYVDSLTAAATNYGVYVATNDSYFGGAIVGGSTLSLTSTATASNLKSDNARNSTYIGIGPAKLGYFVTSLGHNAGAAMTENAQHNTLLGARAGYAITDGDQNTLVGSYAGDALTTGSGNIVIGYNVDAPAVDSANTLNIGGLITSSDMTKGYVSFSAATFANLGTPANGTFAYCSDCTENDPCAGSGTGALAKRLNGRWDCN